MRHLDEMEWRRDIIPDVRYPKEVEWRRDRIPDVRYPEEVECWWTEFRM